MTISKDTVRYVAALARVELLEKEIEQLTGQLDRILEYVHKLKSIDVDNLKPTSHVLSLKNVYREDAARSPLGAENVMKNAPSREDNLFKVQKIIE
jgi:aspartyl-tRNA(Asn)/glutamyl-tRNA(Gln) amidotransferase subunit C